MSVCAGEDDVNGSERRYPQSIWPRDQRLSSTIRPATIRRAALVGGGNTGVSERIKDALYALSTPKKHGHTNDSSRFPQIL